jgi:Rrf2 family protein
VLSQTVEYALRAFLYIARRSPDSVRLSEVASATRAPHRYLAKILAQLTHAGFLESSRGPAGGYRLSPKHARASLAAVAAVFEPVTTRRCLLGDGICGRNPGCPVHDRWSPIANQMTAFFSSTTVADLVEVTPPSAHASS